MELSTQTVDKILEALAPSLSAELERVLQEAQRQQEEEFGKRLEAAVHEAESAVTELAEAEKEKAVADARSQISAEMQAEKEKAIADACEKVSADLRSQSQETLRQSLDELRADFAKQAQATAEQWAAEKSSLQDQANLWRIFAEGPQQLSDSATQAEMLTRFLNIVEPFAGSVAVYVARADGLALWKSRGKGAFSELVSKDTIDPESFFKPLVVREKTVAAVCAVRPYKAEPLDFLSSCLGRAIEAFGLKLKTSVPRPPALAVGATAVPAVVAGSPSPAPATGAAPDEKLAAEARQAARLLVSEIKLYNEQSVRDGRAASDLYARLQKQIDQGRDQYLKRIDTGALSRDYYHDELVRVLADGHADRLGGDYPGPMIS